MVLLAGEFQTLNPNVYLTNHVCEMQGDVLEICMVAMRGHPEFADVLPATGLPEIVNTRCSVCCSIQYIDDCLRIGKLDCQGSVGIELLTNPLCWPERASHAFVHAWLLDAPNSPTRPSIVD